jgi:hypothetical protein
VENVIPTAIVILVFSVAITILGVAILIAPLKLYGIHKELRETNAQLERVNGNLKYSHELQKYLAETIKYGAKLTTKVERKAEQLPTSASAPLGGFCKYCGVAIGEGETCERCKQKGG